MAKWLSGATGVGIGVALIACVLLLQPLIVWLLWNPLMPKVMNVSNITFLQAIGLCIIGHCLSGSWIRPVARKRTGGKGQKPGLPAKKRLAVNERNIRN